MCAGMVGAGVGVGWAVIFLATHNPHWYLFCKWWRTLEDNPIIVCAHGERLLIFRSPKVVYGIIYWSIKAISYFLSQPLEMKIFLLIFWPSVIIFIFVITPLIIFNFFNDIIKSIKDEENNKNRK